MRDLRVRFSTEIKNEGFPSRTPHFFLRFFVKLPVHGVGQDHSEDVGDELRPDETVHPEEMIQKQKKRDHAEAEQTVPFPERSGTVCFFWFLSGGYLHAAGDSEKRIIVIKNCSCRGKCENIIPFRE